MAARPLSYYQELIISKYVAEREARGLPVDNPANWSMFSIKKLWVYVIAFLAHTLDNILGVHFTETQYNLSLLKPTSRQWYANLIKNFQLGFPLITDTHHFNNTGYTPSEIEASKVIKYVAVIKQINLYGRVQLRLKIAGSNGNDLQQIDSTVVDALTTYLDTVGAPAGDNYIVEGKNYDKLKMKWIIYYDPLILDAQGARLDGSSTSPVRDAIKNFLKDVSNGGGMPFSGTYVLQYHIDAVQQVQGVIIPEIVECSAQFGLLPFSAINTKYDPDAGWLRFDVEDDLEIEYIAQQSLQ